MHGGSLERAFRPSILPFTQKMNLTTLGWTERLAEAFEPFAARSLVPARIAVEHRSRYVLYAADGEHDAVLAGKLRQENDLATSHPVVGDWVAVRRATGDGPAVIHAVLPRATRFA